jgi:hypothetical protein
VEREPPSTAPRRRDVAGLVLLLLLFCLLLQQLRSVFFYGRLATDEDQTLLWYAGQQLAHLSVHEPSFYGQNYNTILEAVPGEILHLLGMSLALASPLGCALLASACWLVLAWAAGRRGQLLAAGAALALPVCLSLPYLLLFDAPRGVLGGDLLAAIAVAGALTIRRLPWRVAVLIGAGGLAVAWENAAALVVIPALAATVAAELPRLRERRLQVVKAASLSALVPALWLLADRWWYGGHRFDLTAPAVNTRLSPTTLANNLAHPGRLFAFYAPELWRASFLPLILIAALLIAAIVMGLRTRRPAPVAAALSFLAVLLFVLAVNDTRDLHPDLYLAGSRFLLPMPLGLWVVFYFTVARRTGGESQSSLPASRSSPRTGSAGAGLGLIVALTLASLLVGQAQFGSQVQAVTAADRGHNPAIVVVNPTALLTQCDALSGTYRRTGAQLLVTFQRDVAYGCAAQSGLPTLNPEYDRRGWIVRAVAAQPITRILVEGWPCQSIAQAAGTCQAESGGTVLLSTPRRPATTSLRLGGIPVRGA